MAEQSPFDTAWLDATLTRSLAMANALALRALIATAPNPTAVTDELRLQLESAAPAIERTEDGAALLRAVRFQLKDLL